VEIADLVTRLFGAPLEMGIHGCLSSHVYRWKIFGNQHLKVYLDHSLGPDWGQAPEGSPGQFISVGLGESWTENDSDADTIPDHSAWMLLIGTDKDVGMSPRKY